MTEKILCCHLMPMNEVPKPVWNMRKAIKKQAQRRQEKGIEEKKTETPMQWNNTDGDLGDPVPQLCYWTAHRPQAIIHPLPFTVSFFRKTALAKLLIKVCFNSKTMIFGSEMDLRIKPNTGQGVGERHFGSCFLSLLKFLISVINGSEQGKGM